MKDIIETAKMPKDYDVKTSSLKTSFSDIEEKWLIENVELINKYGARKWLETLLRE